MSGRNSPTGSPAAPASARLFRRPAPPSSPLRAPPAAPSVPAPVETPRPLPNGFDVDRPRFTLPLGHGVHPRQRIPVIATSPAYHGHPPQRLLQNFPDTTPATTQSSRR